jgi:hypothetical protein
MSVVIVANNLRPEAIARLGTSSVQLDLAGDFRVPLTREVERLTDGAQMKRDGALRFSLPQSATNDAVLVEYATPLTVDRSDDYIDVSLFVDGVPMPFSRLYVVGKNDKQKQWEVELEPGDAHWSEAAGNKRINSINFGWFGFTYANILTSWQQPEYDGDFEPQDGGANKAYYWPVIDYGNWVDRSEPDQNDDNPTKMVALEDLRPLVNLAYLLKRGFSEIGWKLVSPVLDTPWARRLWCYLLRPGYYEGVGADGNRYGRFCRIIGRSPQDDLQIDTLSSNPQRFIYFRSLDYAGSSTATLPHAGGPSKWLCGVKNELPFKARFRLSIKCDIQTLATPVLPRQLTFNVQEVVGAQNDGFSGLILSDDVTLEVQPNSTSFFSADFEFDLEPWQKAAIHWTSEFAGDAFVIKKGMCFRCEHANKSFLRGDQVDVRTALRDDITLLDVLKAYMHLINGRIKTDYVSRTIEVHPARPASVYGQNVEGYIDESAEAIDVGQRVVSDSFSMKFKRLDLKRFSRFSFKSSSDAYIESLPLSEPAHSLKVLNGEDLQDEVEQFENVLFEPTLEGQSQLLKVQQYKFINNPQTEYAPRPYLPRLWDNADGERSFGIGPRLLFAFGYVKQKNPRPLSTNLADTFASLFFDVYDASTSTFGYATQLRTWPVDPAPTVDGSVVFDGARPSLFAMFYAQEFKDRQKGAQIEVLQFIDAREFSSFDFRRRCVFNYEGRQVSAYAQQLRDFQPPLPTPVVYEVPAHTTSRCALPCSCLFRQCDYFHDFNTEMQQSALDAMQVRSFKVEGVELLSQPVGLGKMSAIDIGGALYVTNLVDTLNSIGAAHFRFAYSARKHSTLGARFFTIKHPACWPFEIIVEHNGDDVFRYTHDKQEQRWTSSSWAPFGAGAETYNAPDNCSQEVEFII